MSRLAQHRWLPYWLRVAGHDAPEADPARLRACFSGLGINSRVWKLYAEYGDDLLRPLAGTFLAANQPNASMENALAYLRLLSGCEVDIAPPAQLVAALLHCNLPGRSISILPVAVFRGAWRALVQAEYRGTTAEAFVRSEFVPVMRWFFERNLHSERDTNRGKAAWAWLRSRWADEQTRRALPNGRAEWTTALEGAEIGHLRFVPLLSAVALQDEGQVMKHCVAELAEFCRSGCIHVFSVRDAKTLDRVATLALGGSDGVWEIVQLKGEQNSMPDERTIRASWGFLRCFEECAPTPTMNAEDCQDCLNWL